MDLESLKPEGEEGVRYLVDEGHAFLEKDTDALCIDIDLSDKKLHLGYDPILQGLQNERLLEACGKHDEIIPPEFRLDHLDSLALSPNMIVAGEMLPSANERADDETTQPEMRFSADSKERLAAKINSDKRRDPRDGVMSVVAISTDKVSNTTQIVINTGEKEQIYQGKTSELIEATENFPKLTRIDGSKRADEAMFESSQPGNQYEAVISEALGELGITEDSLQSISLGEHRKIWMCPQDDCGRQFYRLRSLKGHLLTHYGVRPFKCDFDQCTWAFYTDFKLRRHKATHLKLKEHACMEPGCDRRFTTMYNLLTHAQLHERPYHLHCSVPECSERFQTRRDLNAHMRTHDESHAPYVCNEAGCGKRYYSSNALTSHQRSHSYKESDVRCSWPGCGKLFAKPCRLKAHVMLHTGCKPYRCTYEDCQWAFASSSKLKRHQKKHTNERNFFCFEVGCGKGFKRLQHLREHSLTHKNLRCFQCCICKAEFTAKSSLYVHIKKHRAAELSEATREPNVAAPAGAERGAKVPAPAKGPGEKCQGSARTALTYNDVSRQKGRRAILESTGPPEGEHEQSLFRYLLYDVEIL